MRLLKLRIDAWSKDWNRNQQLSAKTTKNTNSLEALRLLELQFCEGQLLQITSCWENYVTSLYSWPSTYFFVESGKEIVESYYSSTFVPSSGSGHIAALIGQQDEEGVRYFWERRFLQGLSDREDQSKTSQQSQHM